MKRDIERISQPERSGTIFVSPTLVLPSPWWDCPALREATPAARFGNLFVLNGSFHVLGLAASSIYWEATKKLYAEKPDEAGAEALFRKSAELDAQAYFVYIDLGNLLLKRGARDQALQAYTQVLTYAPNDQLIRKPISEQIEKLNHSADRKILPLRNPAME